MVDLDICATSSSESANVSIAVHDLTITDVADVVIVPIALNMFMMIPMLLWSIPVNRRG